MKLNVGIKYCENNQCDVHGIYSCVYWNIELAHDYALDDELARTDIWADGNLQGETRLRYQQGKSTLLDKFCQEFNTNNDSLLKLLYNETTFKNFWYLDLDYYNKNTVIFPIIYKDLQGFSMTPHLDNHHIIGQLIINLTNNQTGTEFYHIDSYTPYYQDSGEKNKGVLFLNTPGSMHGIRNITQDRYILYASLLLKGN